MKWYNIVNKSPDVAEIMIYDEVGLFGVSAHQFKTDLNAIKAGAINLRINSVGGNIFDGFAIHNAIKDHPATFNVFIDGLAASIASVIAMAGDSVCMAKNAWMMIHNGSNFCMGDSKEMRRMADLLDGLNKSIAQSYVDKTKKPIEEITALMAAETWFNADDAKSFGLCDKIADDDSSEEARASAMKACLKYPNSPAPLRKFAATLIKEREKMENVYTRDGKNFIKVDGKEIEIGLPAPVAVIAAPAPVAVAAPIVAAPAPAPAAVDATAVKAAGYAEGLAYAKDFSTALSMANITGQAATDFTAKFYGRNIEDVKFLVSHAMGVRAAAVGEGNPAGEPTNTAEGKDAAMVKEVTERWHSDISLRKLHGVHTNDKADPKYVARLARLIAVERKSVGDTANNSARIMNDNEPSGDAVSRLLKNKSVFVNA